MVAMHRHGHARAGIAFVVVGLVRAASLAAPVAQLPKMPGRGRRYRYTSLRWAIRTTATTTRSSSRK